MASPPPPTGPPRRRAPAFQPRFSLMIIYLLAFFVVFCFLLIMPALLGVLGSMEPGPQQEEAAKLAAQSAMQGKVLPAAILAIVTTGAGAYFQILPGLKGPLS